MFYWVCVRLLQFLFLFAFRVRRTGVSNVPLNGGAMLAVNHKSMLDPIVAGITCPRKLHFMAKAELFKNKFFGKLIKTLGAFPVNRGAGDIGAIKAAFKIFNDGNMMLIFPEGGRVKNGQKRRAKPGVAMIAQRASVPVIPVHIDGEYKWMGKITVRYGAPITFEEYKGQKLSTEEIQNLADDVLDKIYSMK